jgi:molybdopterin synthase catalytic subunit
MVEIRREDFSIDEVIKKMKDPKVGAIAIYLGTVREFSGGIGLAFEDDNRAVSKLEEIEKRAINKFDVEDVAIVHRVGFLGISENILLVTVSASHRKPAFDACRSIIDDIKDFHKSWGKEVLK